MRVASWSSFFFSELDDPSQERVWSFFMWDWLFISHETLSRRYLEHSLECSSYGYWSLCHLIIFFMSRRSKTFSAKGTLKVIFFNDYYVSCSQEKRIIISLKNSKTIYFVTLFEIELFVRWARFINRFQRENTHNQHQVISKTMMIPNFTSK